ncbi:MAG: ribosome small subunit-dependent GTPase A [Deltaproteobacteria bacterium]|nr:ribosome small subunit-dependent GTPase A [Deltaproteobacteria bacterium]
MGKSGRKDSRDTRREDTDVSLREGLMAAVYADRCLVWSEGAEYVCSLRGRLKLQGTPVVGDRVRFHPHTDGSGAVAELMARRTVLKRGTSERKRSARGTPPQVLAANVEQMVVVAAMAQPPFRQGLVDRFLVAARQAGLDALLCLNKVDLDPEAQWKSVAEDYRTLGYPVLATSMQLEMGFEALRQALRGRISVLVGHSGVGKTSLLNAVEGTTMNVGAVDERLDRGRHTTTTARLLPLADGGFVIDSPGIREFGLHGLAPGDLAALYPDFQHLESPCGFRDCLHRTEPGCAVRTAAEQGKLLARRYEGYLKLLEETQAEQAGLHPGERA